MALNIKDPETDRLARQLAELTGESITSALRQALQARIESVQGTRRRESARTSAVLDEVAARGRARAVLDPRTPDEIIGYDESGLPS